MKSNYLGSERHRENARSAASLANEWHRQKRQERVAAYDLNPKRCQRSGCSNPIPYERKNINRFCGSSCAAFHNTAKRDCSHPDERRKKIKKALLQRSVDAGRRVALDVDALLSISHECANCKEKFSTTRHRNKFCKNCSEEKRQRREDEIKYGFQKSCAFCGVSFVTMYKNTKTCSFSCARSVANLKIDKEKQKERGQAAIRKLMDEGRWKGWSGRGAPSFPEKYVSGLLDARGISYETEYRIDRFSLDFAFPDLKIDFEVDGKQHDQPKQAAHDINRDAFLTEHGWTVFRLKWASIKNPVGKEKVQEQFDKFLTLLNARGVEKALPAQKKSTLRKSSPSVQRKNR